MTQPSVKFTAEVAPMFGNIELGEMEEGEILELIADTYDIPEDCIRDIQVKY